jgi:hypothetical protein
MHSVGWLSDGSPHRIYAAPIKSLTDIRKRQCETCGEMFGRGTRRSDGVVRGAEHRARRQRLALLDAVAFGRTTLSLNVEHTRPLYTNFA